MALPRSTNKVSPRKVSPRRKERALRTVQAAVDAHHGGNLAEAARLYQTAIESDPGLGVAHHYFGLLHQEQGELEAAKQHLSKAVRTLPDDAKAHNNLANVLRGLGRLTEAVHSYRRAVGLDPHYVNAHFNLAGVQRESGDREGALESYRKVIELAPRDGDAWSNFATLLAETGALEEAFSASLRWADAEPHNPLAHVLTGRLMRLTGTDPAGAIERLRRGVDLGPNCVDAWMELGATHKENGELPLAARAFERVCELEPSHLKANMALSQVYLGMQRTPDAVQVARAVVGHDPSFAAGHSNLGIVLHKLGDGEAALAAYRRALELDPEFAEAYNNKGLVHQDKGEMDQASACYQRALTINPKLPVAWLGLSGTRRYGPQDLEDLEGLHALAKECSSDDDTAAVNFALGKIYDDCQRYDEAFEYFKLANASKRRLVKFDPRHFSHWQAQYRQVFDEDFFTKARFQGEFRGLDSQRPVFIVGMPRSGTSLVEQILSSHPDVHGAGELIEVTKITESLALAAGVPYPQCVPHTAPQKLGEAAHRYLAHLENFDPKAARVTDKMPTNFFHLGLLALLFPKARVIHCRRDALDVALSNFQQQFTDGQFYSYDLDDIAVYYRGYESVMAHWRAVLPISLYEVDYEELVQDQERVSRQLVEFLGLPWDPRCLDFHRNQRAVHTASNWQVRQPIYRRSAKRWKNYEVHLQGLKEALHYVDKAE